MRWILSILLTVGAAYADDANYRLAGVIAPLTTEWVAVIELPDGEQVFVNEGDYLGNVRVEKISKREVSLDYPNGIRVLQLDSIGFNEGKAETEEKGISANDFTRMLESNPDLKDSNKLPGLVDMYQLSSDAIILSINGISLNQMKEGVYVIQDALDKGEQIRLTLSGDTSLPIIYLKPGHVVE